MATVITSTIGTSGDYATPQAWNDACPADLVALDQIWRGELLDEEFSSGTGPVITMGGGTVTDATRYKILASTTAADFRNQINLATDPLRVDPTRGACITSTGSYQSQAVVLSDPYSKIEGVQIRATNSGAGSDEAVNGVSTTELISCLVEAYTVPIYNAIKATNCVILCRGSVGFGASAVYGINSSSNSKFYNCHLISLVGGNAIRTSYNTTTLKNCSVFGFGNIQSGPGGTVSATDCATDETTPFSGFTDSLIFADQFENIVSGTHDFRLKAGSDLFDLGVTDATNAPVDMFGTTRPVGASDIGTVETVSADTTPPVLTVPTGTATGDTTATGSVSTDEANGTLYAVVTTSATAPSVPQIQAGQDNAGAAAAYATSQAVSATGVQNISATGLAPSTAYYIHYQHEDAAANDSTVVTSAQFTTAASSDTTPDAYSFTDQTDVALSTLTTSNTITVTGIDASTPISITGGEYSINGGAYTASPGNVVVNDTVTLRVTSSASYNTLVDVDLDIGGVLDTWSVTTAQLVSDIMANNTGSAWASQAVVWSWLPAGRFGALSAVTPQDGTGTTAANGRLTLTEQLTPPGILLAAKQNTDATDDDVYYEAFA